jgi:hypothetical protein
VKLSGRLSDRFTRAERVYRIFVIWRRQGTLVGVRGLLEQAAPTVLPQSFVHERQDQTHDYGGDVLQRDHTQIVEHGGDLQATAKKQILVVDSYIQFLSDLTFSD